MPLSLTSPGFADGDPIPEQHTRDGRNLSPALEWSDAPEATQSFALVVDDPDAPSGTFSHWGLYNIPATAAGLAEGHPMGHVERAANDYGNGGYEGPNPPRGHGVHHYHFRLAALATPRLYLPATAKVVDVWRAAREHVLAEALLVGTYER